jgi:hypothetical protein
MAKSKAELRAWESRWAAPVAAASVIAAVLLLVSTFLDPVSGDGQAELLRSADANGGGILLSKLMQIAGFLLLAFPLVYLFRAVRARSDRVRGQLIGLVMVAPIFLAVSSGLSIGATSEAADQFVAGEAKLELSRSDAKEECRDEDDAGADCVKTKLEDDEASNAVGEASLAAAVSGLGLAGAFGFAVALFYIGLWSMRTGVLSRFWGSFGMVAGIALFLGPLFFFVTLVWFTYVGLLLAGVLPGGKPPAWEAGEAVPWPTPGEKAAAELEPEGDLEEEPAEDALGAEGGGDGDAPKRKRKQRE